MVFVKKKALNLVVFFFDFALFYLKIIVLYNYNFSFKTAISSRSLAAIIKSNSFAAASMYLRFSLIRFSISSFGKYYKSCSAANCFALS